MDVLGVKAAKDVDRYAIDNIGIPSIVLMENAAQGIFNNVVNLGESFLVFCGVGNNGADGLVIARKLILAGKSIRVYIVSNLSKATEEFNINYNILLNMNADIEEIDYKNLKDVREHISRVDIIIDSIFGIGLNRGVSGDLKTIIEYINKYSKYIVSVDNPSGLNCDKGTITEAIVRANKTFAITTYKKGFFNKGVKDYLGEIKLINIGIPNDVIENFSENIKCLVDDEYKKMIPKRGVYGHKGSYGRVLILAGSKGMTGAAYITTEASIRTGAGLVTLVVDKEIQEVMSNKLIEAMTINYDDLDKLDELIEKADVIVCGPGLGVNDKSKYMLNKCVENSSCKMVIDADALNIISNDNDLIEKLKSRAIFTPHSGEMARLTNLKIEDIESNRLDVCRKYSFDNSIVTLLKGYNTVISDGNSTIINTTGNSKMASGGMGDCLTGIISGFLAQGVSLIDSAALGAYVHGFIGDMLSEASYIVNARDILDKLPKTIEYICKS